MKDTEERIRFITDMTIRSARQKVTGRNAFAANLFDFVCGKSELQDGFLLFCTDSGLILRIWPPCPNSDVVGRTVSLEGLRESDREMVFCQLPAGCILVSSNGQESVSDPENLQSCLRGLLGIAEDYEKHETSLLSCLDSVRNAISICDRDAHLLYANETFCNFFQINNRSSAIGMHIDDIMDQFGIKAVPMESNATHLKMMDVLKTGKEELDCSVRLESKTDPNCIRLVDNDLYPIFGEQGEVTGLIEIARSYQQVMKRTRKIIGLTAESNFKDIIGNSPAIREKIKLAKEFAQNSGNVLITGESGVGKELFAQSIHNYSTRRKGPFVALNCASFPAELIESELFGYVEGAFTGASKKGQIGKIELADGGTLFLDEIGELPYYFQSKLLRVLESWIVTRVGSTKEVLVDVRLIAATNRNLEEMAAAGLFRQDLYYRLQVLDIEIPPLRDRQGDVRLLAEYFLRRSAEQNGSELKKIDGDAIKVLEGCDWRGNARELRNFINRVDLLTKKRMITADVLNAYLNPKETAANSLDSEAPKDRITQRRKEVDASYVNLLREALSVTNGNKKEAAELLGVSRRTFYRMLEKYNL